MEGTRRARNPLPTQLSLLITCSTFPVSCQKIVFGRFFDMDSPFGSMLIRCKSPFRSWTPLLPPPLRKQTGRSGSNATNRERLGSRCESPRCNSGPSSSGSTPGGRRPAAFAGPSGWVPHADKAFQSSGLVASRPRNRGSGSFHGARRARGSLTRRATKRSNPAWGIVSK